MEQNGYLRCWDVRGTWGLVHARQTLWPTSLGSIGHVNAPRRPTPLEADATDAERIPWLIAELHWHIWQTVKSWRVAWVCVVVNLAAAGFNLWTALR